MIKKKIVNIDDVRREHRERGSKEYDKLHTLLEYLDYVIQSRIEILESMCNEAKEAVEDAGLNFSKFSLNKDYVGAYYCGTVNMFADDSAFDSLDDEDKQKLETIYSKPVLKWSCESNNGTRYQLFVHYNEPEDEQNDYELSSGLCRIDADGTEFEYNYRTHEWDLFGTD